MTSMLGALVKYAVVKTAIFVGPISARYRPIYQVMKILVKFSMYKQDCYCRDKVHIFQLIQKLSISDLYRTSIGKLVYVGPTSARYHESDADIPTCSRYRPIYASNENSCKT